MHIHLMSLFWLHGLSALSLLPLVFGLTNTFALPDWVTMKTLAMLLNKLEVAPFFNTEFNKELTREFPVGETFQVKKPQRFLIRDGLGYTPQPINRLTTPVTCNQVFGVDFEWDSVEQALKLERGEAEIEKQYLEPAANQLKQEIDSRCALFAYQQTNNFVGILGTNPSGSTAFADISNKAREILIQQACPPGMDKGMIVPPEVVTALAPVGASYFNPTSEISRLYKEGSLGRQGGFDWYESMSIYSHTAGTWAGAVTVNTTVVDGDSSIVVNCTSGDTFKTGDKIGIGGRYAVNPSTRRITTTARTRRVTVVQDTTATGATATIYVSPTFYGPGSQYQNIDVLPVSGDVLTLFPGTTSPNGVTGKVGLAIQSDAFALVSVKFANPKAVEIASQTRDPETGISLAFVRAFDPIQRKMVNRFDVCMGFGALYPDNCCVAVLSA